MDDRSLLPGWDAVAPDGGAPGLGQPPRTAAGQTEPAEPVPAPPGTFGLRILAVSEVTRAIREAVRSDPRLSDVWVEGEVGRVTVSSAGHAYFTLKDARSTLSCVWFSDERARSAFQPQAGLRIVVHGRIDLFEQQGAVQLYVESIQPAGFGDLAIRFEALKARLAAEGLFDAARKRPLPQRPTTIAVITSPAGVVWRDIATVLARRWPMTTVLLVACKVQGDDAPESIVRAFARLERWIAAATGDGRADDLPQVTILARGGGSLEDLWSFNDERVVRAVVAHRLPVVCGVGHEVDVTLADFAADVRAATPSAAAELVVPDRADWMAAFRRAGERTAAAVGRTLDAA
ncbi:MAG: exodeoxyribonuclease VII large subunit, partial [Chloroflexota bacterium]|nr:exodeoxyribonuclease VII large subunit [Chloroflexota bacterium]